MSCLAFWGSCKQAYKEVCASQGVCMIAGLTGKAVISEMDAKTFSMALSWMYGTINRSLTAREAIDVYMVSDRLGLMSLHRSCFRILLNSLRLQPGSELIDEVEQLWHYAKVLEAKPIIKVSIHASGCAGFSVRTHNLMYAMLQTSDQKARS